MTFKRSWSNPASRKARHWDGWNYGHSCLEQETHYDCLSFILDRQTSCLSQHSSPTIPLQGEGRGRGQICHVRLVKCSNGCPQSSMYFEALQIFDVFHERLLRPRNLHESIVWCLPGNSSNAPAIAKFSTSAVTGRAFYFAKFAYIEKEGLPFVHFSAAASGALQPDL